MEVTNSGLPMAAIKISASRQRALILIGAASFPNQTYNVENSLNLMGLLFGQLV